MNRVVNPNLSTKQREMLISTFGNRIQHSVSLARYTAARIGGAADWLLVVDSVDQLAETVIQLWSLDVPFFVLGGGSNVLVSDLGIRQPVILNKARQVYFDMTDTPNMVLADSGVNFGLFARQCAQRGLSGLEWAAGIPGTVGGAVFGNAGAHGEDMTGSLQMAEILHRTVQGITRLWLSVEDLDFEYRSSKFKRDHENVVILRAQFELQTGDRDGIQGKMIENAAYRRKTQPPGASMGSMFKNPPGDFAGRLIEAAGLKATRIGAAEISSVHANFFINNGNATAFDVYSLILLAQRTVLDRFGVKLELEVELIGEW